MERESGATQATVASAANHSRVQAVGSSSPEGLSNSASHQIRGVIEGFYGQPWTFAQRFQMFSFMQQNGFNTYVYAPKDDPYQRAEWWKLYPPGQANEMQRLVGAAKSDGIQFVYSLSPGIPQPLSNQTLTSEMVNQSITFTSDSDRRQLEAKINQLRTMGVETFMLSFDDVEKRLKPADQLKYGNDYARAHANLANQLFQDEHRQDPQFQLWLAPTIYHGLADNHDWQTIRTRLNPAVQVIWTGGWVLNRQITGQEVAQVTRWLGRKPILWDNYPVNDYTYVVKQAPALLLGPLENRSADLESHLAGYIANPMIQSEASKIPLATVALFLRDPATYIPTTAWARAVQFMPGVHDAAALLKFCEYSSQSTLNEAGYAPFAKLAEAYWRAKNVPARQQAELNLQRELETLATLGTRLQKSTDNQALLDEINPWLAKLSQEGEAGLLALNYAETQPGSQRVVLKQQIDSRLKQLRNDPRAIGAEVVAFIERVVGQ